MCRNCMDAKAITIAYKFDPDDGEYIPISVCGKCANEFPEPELYNCDDHEWVATREGSDAFVCRWCGQWYGATK